jgi:hypothetical protein
VGNEGGFNNLSTPTMALKDGPSGLAVSRLVLRSLLNVHGEDLMISNVLHGYASVVRKSLHPRWE